MSFFFSGRNTTAEYKAIMPHLVQVVDDHKSQMIAGAPQLNICDNAVMVRTRTVVVFNDRQEQGSVSQRKGYD